MHKSVELKKTKFVNKYLNNEYRFNSNYFAKCIGEFQRI